MGACFGASVRELSGEPKVSASVDRLVLGKGQTYHAYSARSGDSARHRHFLNHIVCDRLYVTVDDFCQERLPAEPVRRGPRPSLTRSETITLALFGQLTRFRSERDFWLFACLRLPTSQAPVPPSARPQPVQPTHATAPKIYCRSLLLSDRATQRQKQRL